MKFYSTAKNYVQTRGQTVKQKASVSMRRNLLVIKRGLEIETQETKVMLNIYHQYTQGKASKDEMRQANKQFVNLIRGLGLGVLTILPFSPITIPAIVKLGDRFGINVLPASFDFSRSDEGNGEGSREGASESEIEGEIDSEIKSTTRTNHGNDANTIEVAPIEEADKRINTPPKSPE